LRVPVRVVEALPACRNVAGVSRICHGSGNLGQNEVGEARAQGSS